MTEETNDQTIRSQANDDDARLAERMKSIMAPKPAKPAKGRAAEGAAGNPGWMKSKPKAKPAKDESAKPARPTKRKTTSTARPPKNSEESWKLAAEHIARQDAGE